MKVNPEMDDLLSSYVDGELSARQNTEIRRLAEKNEQVRAQLQGLENIKALISTLPRLEPPPEIAGQVRSLLERKTLFDDVPGESKRPKYELLFRKLRAGAAVAGLVAVFGLLVYSIIAPPPHQAGEQTRLDAGPSARSLPPQLTGFQGMSGRLELSCASLPSVDSLLQRSIELHGIATHERRASSGRIVHHVECSRSALIQLILDLQSRWPQFAETRLSLDTPRFGQCVEVVSVSPRQLIAIVSQNDTPASLETAKQIAVQNSINRMTCTGQVLASLVDTPGMVPVAPKPMLTSAGPKPNSEQAATGPAEWVSLTIMLTGGK